MITTEERRPEAKNAGAAAIAVQVEADLHVWAARWPVFSPARFPAVAHTTAVHLPELSHAARALAALVSLWIIAFDEIVDEDRLTSSQLADMRERCRTIITRPDASPTVQADPLCASLQEIVHRLSQRSTFAALATAWQEAFLDMLEAIVEHRRLAGGRVQGGSAATTLGVPSFAAVLALTTRSIGVSCYLISSWILYEEPALILRREALLRSAAAASQAIRLANDLQTWKRDAAEGNVNTLAALQWELAAAAPGLPADHCRALALHMLRQQLVAALARTRTQLHHSAMPNSSVERDMERLVAFVTQLYARSDYHTYIAPPTLVAP